MKYTIRSMFEYGIMCPLFRKAKRVEKGSTELAAFQGGRNSFYAGGLILNAVRVFEINALKV